MQTNLDTQLLFTHLKSMLTYQLNSSEWFRAFQSLLTRSRCFFVGSENRTGKNTNEQPLMTDAVELCFASRLANFVGRSSLFLRLLCCETCKRFVLLLLTPAWHESFSLKSQQILVDVFATEKKKKKQKKQNEGPDVEHDTLYDVC